ncbi:MAG: tRNA 2-thiouridine(34) synthase MnmA, partial [Bacilli bacterium]|nr:tRNA 2-thiouridine(34) synthase MnmA [Bacilli bacterium]
KIVDIDTNRKIGDHEGVMYYTIGQRRGLGIGGIANEEAKGWFVVKKDVKNNILYVASGSESDRLNSDSCLVTNLNFISGKPKEGEHINVKFRYRQQDNGVTIHYVDEDTVKLVYDSPYKAVTPGQAAVFYQGEICLGGGLIHSTYYKNKRTDL